MLKGPDFFKSQSKEKLSLSRPDFSYIKFHGLNNTLLQFKKTKATGLRHFLNVKSENFFNSLITLAKTIVKSDQWLRCWTKSTTSFYFDVSLLKSFVTSTLRLRSHNSCSRPFFLNWCLCRIYLITRSRLNPYFFLIFISDFRFFCVLS